MLYNEAHFQYFTFVLFAISASANNGYRVPNFIQEPSSKVVFSNDTGTQISCTAHGTPMPVISWVLKTGSPASQVAGLRQTLGNGTLYFPPFLEQYFRADVHDTTYRCRAVNEAGILLSRDVHVQAVIRRSFRPRVDNIDVFLNGAAFVRCLVPEYARQYVSVASWFKGDEILTPELSDIGGRFVVLPISGDLYIRTIQPEDASIKFSCMITNPLNGDHVRSDSTNLSIKEMSTNMAPRTNQKPVIEISMERGNDVHLPCNIQGNPQPLFTWFRVSDSGALYPIPSSQRVILSRTLLLIKNADDRDTGKWTFIPPSTADEEQMSLSDYMYMKPFTLDYSSSHSCVLTDTHILVCQASNQFGEQRIEIRLVVNSYLSVHILPQVQIVNSGGTAIFNCSATGTSIDSVEWLHNGKPVMEDNALRTARDNLKILSPVTLLVENVGRQDRGIYQCLIGNHKSSAQAMAELKLGDTVPEMLYTFIDQNVRQGPQVSLKCSATGTPPPQISWLLDSQPIMGISSLHRFAIGQFVDMSGDVISHLNISHVRPDDGGLYKCVAGNTMGSVSHAARLNVYGPPYVRAIGPTKAVAGEDITIYCPYSGYPIDSIRWEKAHQEIISNSNYEVSNVQQGGYIKLKQVDPTRDAGLYTCSVRSRSGEEARRDMELLVNSPPVIEPFKFPTNIQEGGRAQITCSVSSGDMPIYFNWKKDGSAIPISLQVTEKKEEFFSMLVFKDINSKHSGKYACQATNAAAKVNFTAELLVRVAPKWVSEPMDTAVLLGNQIIVKCEAEGYPPPAISWLRSKDKSSKDFESIHLKNSSLVVNFATESDEGYYMCQASNNIGNPLTKLIRININEPARFEESDRNISAKRNDPVTLTCCAKGDDPISVAWTHNNGRIDLNNYRFSIAEVKSDKGVDSQLSISRSDRHDSGIYKCSAENPYGRSEQTIFLAVQERPDTPSNLEVFEVSSRSVKLTWRRPFDGNSPVLSYVVQYQPLKFLQSHSVQMSTKNDWDNIQTVNVTLPSTSVTKSYDLQEQATVAGLSPATTYLLRMQAINEIEKSQFTDPIVLKTQEEAPTESPSNIQVQTGGQSELIVTWQIPPRSSWNGELLGYSVNCTEEKQNINYISTANSSVKSVTVYGWATSKTTVHNLRKYTRYAVSVRALNSFGPGPWSAVVMGTTLEGVPESPPQNVSCSALSSQSMKILWQEPSLQHHGGIIQGYKILYRPLVNKTNVSSKIEIKRTSNLETFLHTLYKATNYSVKVLAYTSSGDGVSSEAIYCTTEDDVPDAPANIKAAALTPDSILVSWLAPVHRNGVITHYNVYVREAGRKGQPKVYMVRVDELGNPTSYEARGLIENQMYEFWVSGSTSVGEGEPTAAVAQTTNTRAPARIASFSQIVQKAVGSTLLLECIAVGNPTPRARWLTRDRPVTFSPFYEVTAEGNLKIHSIESSLSGNYTCSANNLFGKDEIIYHVIAMKTPSPPQITVQYASLDSIRISWDAPEDGGAPLQGYTISYRNVGALWSRIELTPDNNAFTIIGLKCGTQYIIKMSAHNLVGDGQPCEEINVWTKGKVPQAPDDVELISGNSSCVNLKLSAWNNAGCPINHFSIEHRRMGDERWTVVTSDISNAAENRENLIFCDFLPAKWYQLKISAINDAGKTTAQYNFATTSVDGVTIPPPAIFPADFAITNSTINNNLEHDWFSTVIVGIILGIVVLLLGLILKHRRTLCGPISEGYESRAIPCDYKEDSDCRRNQQVYSASPVKTVDKANDTEMYEISPYATFSVSGGRSMSSQPKTPTRGVSASNLDYTVQFKTFGHPEGDLNAYPVLASSGFGHIKSKSSWNKQRYYNTDDDSTLSKTMTMVAGGSQIISHHKKPLRDEQRNGRSKSKRISDPSNAGSESDTSASPSADFSNMPTYRVPVKSSREMFHPDSSTESNNDQSSPLDRRTNTPRHVISSSEMRIAKVRSRNHAAKESPASTDLISAGSNNSRNTDFDTVLGFRPPSLFNDSREFSEAECDRERALDLEVQRVMESSSSGSGGGGLMVHQKLDREELTSLLARFQEKKEEERQENTIHV